MGERTALAAATFVAVLLSSGPAQAIRPFVTDDARVVGEKLGQLETWPYSLESASSPWH